MSNINITINLNVDERVAGLLASLISKLGVTTAVAVTQAPAGDVTDQALTEHTRSCVKRLSDAGVSPLGIKTTVYKQFGVNQALEVGPEQRTAFIAALTDYVNTKLQEASHA